VSTPAGTGPAPTCQSATHSRPGRREPPPTASPADGSTARAPLDPRSPAPAQSRGIPRPAVREAHRAAKSTSYGMLSRNTSPPRAGLAGVDARGVARRRARLRAVGPVWIGSKSRRSLTGHANVVCRSPTAAPRAKRVTRHRSVGGCTTVERLLVRQLLWRRPTAHPRGQAVQITATESRREQVCKSMVSQPLSGRYAGVRYQPARRSPPSSAPLWGLLERVPVQRPVRVRQEARQPRRPAPPW
jgi:hypothetical protein